MTWKGFQHPNLLKVEKEEEMFGRYVAEPLERGWGTTIGNAMRRVLLSSIEGAAITAVKIEGVEHEFATLQGVVEDVTDIILNLKSLALRLHEDGPRTSPTSSSTSRRSCSRSTPTSRRPSASRPRAPARSRLATSSPMARSRC